MNAFGDRDAFVDIKTKIYVTDLPTKISAGSFVCLLLGFFFSPALVHLRSECLVSNDSSLHVIAILPERLCW